MSEPFHIVWAPVAIRDLDEILEYIACRETPDAAARLYLRIQERVETLAGDPLRCRVVPELRAVGVDTYREHIISPYRVFFRIKDSEVGILGVLDGRRDLAALLVDRVLRS